MKYTIVVVCLWVTSLCPTAAYLTVGQGIDNIMDHNVQSMWWIGVLGTLGSGVFVWMVNTLGAAQINQMGPALRHSIVRQVFTLGSSQRTDERAGRVIDSVADGVERAAVHRGISLTLMVASLTIPILVVIVVALAINPTVDRFLTIVIPLVPVCVISFRKVFKPVLSCYRHTSCRLITKELDAIQGLGDLTLMNVGKDMGKHLVETTEEVHSKIMSHLADNRLILLVIDPIFPLGIITGAIALALIRHQQDIVSTDEGISLVLPPPIMLGPLGHIGQFFYIGIGGIAANKEITKLIKQTPLVVDARGVKTPVISPQRDEIRLSDVSFSYTKSTPVLQDMNLTLIQREHVVPADPSGVSKSTVSTLLQDPLHPTRDRMGLNGTDLATVPLSRVYAQTAVIGQNTYLLPGTSHSSLLLASPVTTDDQLIEALRTIHLDEFVDTLLGNLNARMGARDLAVSGDEAQRIAITHVFPENTSVMILGKPTTHVDLASKYEVLASLETVCTRRTTLTTSHRDATIRGSGYIMALQEETIR